MRSFKYDPFGNVTSETGTVDAKWRFAGQYWDGQGFYKMGVRWYDAKLGRWTQRDPLDQPLDPSGWNAYVYVGNNPANYVDPTGEFLHRDGVSFFELASTFLVGEATCLLAGVVLTPVGAGVVCGVSAGIMILVAKWHFEQRLAKARYRKSRYRSASR